MAAVLELVMAFLAAVGLTAVGWLAFGKWILPIGGETRRALAVVAAKGDGDGLEQIVHGLLWLRFGGLSGGEAVIVDCGLSDAGRAIAARLERDGNVFLCTPAELAARLTEQSD